MRFGLRLSTFMIAGAAAAGLVGCGSSKPKPITAVVSPSPAVARAFVTPFAGGSGTPGSTPSTNGTPGLTTPSGTPTETPDDSPMARLTIPKIKVDAKFVTLGIIASTNTMDSPKNKDDVGYYDFTPRPGYGGNTVLSGHVDWYTGQTGVFWDLKKLENGDEIDVILQDGKTYKYKVSETHLFDNSELTDSVVDQIIGDTPKEAVTIITCEGVFNQAAAEYNKRRVVRADRVYS